MGVSVSYNGSGGRRSFNLDGVPTGDAAKTLGLAPKKHFVPDTFKKMLQMPAPQDPIEESRQGKVKLNLIDPNPGTLAEKMLPGGGVVVSSQGVCLRGEEQSPLVTGVKLFGSVNGSKTYHTIEEIDPPGQPHRVGAGNADDSPDPNNEASAENQPQLYQVVSRIVGERDTITGLMKLYELDKDVSYSPWGRTTGVTKERRRMIGTFIEGSNAAYKRVPGNFEPTFEDDNGTMKLAHVGNGYVPFGRKFYAAGDNELNDSAKIDTGTIYLEVTHTTSGAPTIQIKGSSSAVDFTQASTSVSLIPLYEITDGAMTLDYRSCMSLTVREV